MRQEEARRPESDVDRDVEGLVLDIDRFATHDGPGIRAAVFLKGCPLRCRWCHSPESQRPEEELLYRSSRCIACGACVKVCPQGAVTLDGDAIELDRSLCTDCGACVDVCYAGALTNGGRRMSVAALVKDLEADAPFFRSSGGGVTVTGGEPLLQHRFAARLLAALRSREIHTAVQTTGYAPRKHLEEVAAEADLVLYDVKAVDDRLHRRYTGVSNDLILDNLRFLAGRHSDILVRVPCIPSVNDGLDEMRAIARFVAGVGLRRIGLLPYNGAAGAKYEWVGRPYSLGELETQSDEHMARLARLCEREGLTVQLGG